VNKKRLGPDGKSFITSTEKITHEEINDDGNDDQSPSSHSPRSFSSSSGLDDSKTIKRTGCKNGPDASLDKINLKDEDHNFMAFVEHFNHVLCGGVVVNSYWVLTTADCLIAIPANETKVIVGSKSMKQHESFAKVMQAKAKHLNDAKYSLNNPMNDIALIELAQPIQYSALVGQACLSEDTPDSPIALTPVFNKQEGKIMAWKMKKFANDDECARSIAITEAKKVFCYEPSGLSSNFRMIQNLPSGPLVSQTDAGELKVTGLFRVLTSKLKINVYTRIGGYNKWIQNTLNSRRP